MQEQLDSIAAQTTLPDELIICDDVSSDATPQILESFAKSAGFPVKLHFNPENLGFVKNFEKAISLCSGDIIFLSDQDDVWRADKLEVMQKYFSDPAVGMVFSNAEIIDAKSQPTGEKLWEMIDFSLKLQHRFNRGDAYKILYRQPLISGCTMAFARKWWPWIKPLPVDIPAIHDIWIALMVALFSEVIAISHPLINHRIHDQQPSAPRRQNVTTQLINKVQSGEKHQLYQDHLAQLRRVRMQVIQAKDLITPQKQEYLQQHMNKQEFHLQNRINMPSRITSRFYVILKELISGRYHHFSNGFKSAFSDLLIVRS